MFIFFKCIFNKLFLEHIYTSCVIQNTNDETSSWECTLVEEHF